MGHVSSSAQWSYTISVELKMLFSLSLASCVGLRLPVRLCNVPVETNDYKMLILFSAHTAFIMCKASLVLQTYSFVRAQGS